jgi:hypothetical protein
MSEIFEIVFFTSSLPEYANKALNIIDPHKLAAGRLYRDSCSLKDDVYIKKFGILGRSLESTIILDNLPTSYCYNINNAVPIKSWFSRNKKDKELREIIPILMSLAKVKDVRKVIMKIIGQMSDDYKTLNKLVYDEYHNRKNIDLSKRMKYNRISEIGNYQKSIDSYDTIKIIEKDPKENDEPDDNEAYRKYAQDGVNLIIFNHLQNSLSHQVNAINAEKNNDKKHK